MTDASFLPVVRLRPKVDARRIRHGAPWVYADDLVLDRRTRALPPGAFAVLEDAARAPLAVVSVNAGSKIAARVMDSDPAARIDAGWIAARIAAALALRDRLYPTPHYRLVHAEGDGLPGLVIDRFDDIAVVQPNAAWAETCLTEIVAALNDVAGIASVYKNAAGRARALEGLDTESGTVAGRVTGPVPVPMNGAVYIADVTGGQKTGLYYDQRENHAFAARLAGGADCLDVFSHVGGFALAMLAAGAVRALAVDASGPALDLAAEGAARMGVSGRFESRQGDAFDTLAALDTEGARFDSVVCDPPAFAPAKPAREAGLRAYERVARLSARLVRPGGSLTLCSCSHAVDTAAFAEACRRGIGRAGRAGQLLRTAFAGPDHPQHPQLAETGYLKALTYRLT